MIKLSQIDQIKNRFLSIVSSLEVMDEEKTNIKELLDDLDNSFGIDSKVARKVAKMMHKGVDAKQQQEFEDINELYNALSSQSDTTV